MEKKTVLEFVSPCFDAPVAPVVVATAASCYNYTITIVVPQSVILNILVDHQNVPQIIYQRLA